MRYLDLVKKLLDEKGILYQYLDGQTPQAQRKVIVEDFQNGKASVFLLSLKAGQASDHLSSDQQANHRRENFAVTPN